MRARQVVAGLGWSTMATIVNMAAVASVTRDDSGRGVLRLRSRSETLPVSQPFMSLFRGM